MSQLFASGGQNIGASASTAVFPMNTQELFPLGWTGWISLQSKGLSSIFSNTTVQKHQFFSAQLFFYGPIIYYVFRTVVLENTLESLLDCKEIQPVLPKGNQSWVFIGRTDAEGETPILWPPDAKS